MAQSSDLDSANADREIPKFGASSVEGFVPRTKSGSHADKRHNGSMRHYSTPELTRQEPGDFRISKSKQRVRFATQDETTGDQNDEEVAGENSQQTGAQLLPQQNGPGQGLEQNSKQCLDHSTGSESGAGGISSERGICQPAVLVLDIVDPDSVLDAKVRTCRGQKSSKQLCYFTLMSSRAHQPSIFALLSELPKWDKA